MKSLTVFKLRHNRRYTTFVSTSKGTVRVCFEPVVMWGRIGNSIFATANEEVIEGLKKHREYGAIFYIAEEGKSEDQYTPELAEEKKGIEDYLSDPSSALREESVTSAATAQLWLQKTHGEAFNATKAADIKIEAAQRFNTIFPNWR